MPLTVIFPLQKLVLQKEALESLQIQLDKAVQKEKQYIQTMVSKEAYEELSRKSAACQDDLTQTLEKVSHTLSSPGLFRVKKRQSIMGSVRVNPLHNWLSPGPSANSCMS